MSLYLGPVLTQSQKGQGNAPQPQAAWQRSTQGDDKPPGYGPVLFYWTECLNLGTLHLLLNHVTTCNSQSSYRPPEWSSTWENCFLAQLLKVWPWFLLINMSFFFLWTEIDPSKLIGLYSNESLKACWQLHADNCTCLSWWFMCHRKTIYLACYFHTKWEIHRGLTLKTVLQIRLTLYLFRLV